MEPELWIYSSSSSSLVMYAGIGCRSQHDSNNRKENESKNNRRIWVMSLPLLHDSDSQKSDIAQLFLEGILTNIFPQLGLREVFASLEWSPFLLWS